MRKKSGPKGPLARYNVGEEGDPNRIRGGLFACRSRSAAKRKPLAALPSGGRFAPSACRRFNAAALPRLDNHPGLRGLSGWGSVRSRAARGRAQIGHGLHGGEARRAARDQRYAEAHGPAHDRAGGRR